MSLFRKILLAMLCISLVPLLISALILGINLGETRQELAGKLSSFADVQASEKLLLQATTTASAVTAFLRSCEQDLRIVTALPMGPEMLKAFYDSRSGRVWQRDPAKPTSGRGIIKEVPLYRTLAVIDEMGRETFVIHKGQILSPEKLRDVAKPENTEFLSERYFNATRKLHQGHIHVTHVTGFHVTKTEQLGNSADPEHALAGKEYEGVVRFSTPLFDKKGKFTGIVVLSLDHRHLMEFSQHIQPGTGTPILFPSYKSGNYAFIFDDEGWIITHPKYWDIRGLDRTGRLVAPYTKDSSPENVDVGRIPYNLDYAGFIHSNYPVAAQRVRLKQSGYVDTTNVGGAKKVMAFAPILYDTGDYSRYGIFGAVTIGTQVDQFHEMSRLTASLITQQIHEHLRESAVIVAATSLVVLVIAFILSRGITRPIQKLTEGIRSLAEGETAEPVSVASGDELASLANLFNQMARELETRKNSLLETLDELSSSRKAIIAEKNFKESILDSISSAILTFSSDGCLTSINGTGRKFLSDSTVPGQHFPKIFAEWGNMPERTRTALTEGKGYGRSPLVLSDSKGTRHFDVGFFPINAEAGGGITVTIRDETEKEMLREEMTRMDRLASLGKLAAGIAHEVRNPLTGISLLLDDLHDRAADSPEVQAMMVKALTEIERVERLVAALLRYASPPQPQFAKADLNKVCEEILFLLSLECERKEITLTFEPGEITPFVFDAEKIKQALLNIVKNAIEAIQESGVITVATARANDNVLIRITDTGPGIPDTDLPLIFEPFFTRKGAGTGLGLSITQQIIHEHHGELGVISSHGFGSEFTLSIPFRVDE